MNYIFAALTVALARYPCSRIPAGHKRAQAAAQARVVATARQRPRVQGELHLYILIVALILLEVSSLLTTL